MAEFQRECGRGHYPAVEALGQQQLVESPVGSMKRTVIRAQVGSSSTQARRRAAAYCRVSTYLEEQDLSYGPSTVTDPPGKDARRAVRKSKLRIDKGQPVVL